MLPRLRREFSVIYDVFSKFETKTKIKFSTSFWTWHEIVKHLKFQTFVAPVKE